MPRISLIHYGEAVEETKVLIENQLARNGRITNMKLTLLHSHPAFHALMEWYPLRDEVKSFATDREINLFCHAVSTQNNCLICSTFFRKLLIDSGDNPDQPHLSEREEILISFGTYCVSTPNGISDEFFARLKKRFTDKQIVDLTAFAGLMIATNLINNVLHVELDDYLESYTKR